MLIPYRESDDWRGRSYRFVRDHLTAAGCDVAAGDAGGDVFSRAASRNLLVRECGADVVILHDADMVTPADAYEQIVDLAARSGRMVVGFTEYRALSQRDTARVLDGADPWRFRAQVRTVGWSVGGIIALTRAAWVEVGGMDERFVGWGCEDFAFAHACSVILGPNLRTDNPAVHLWHPSTRQHDALADNSALMKRYTTATTPDALRAVQTEEADR